MKLLLVLPWVALAAGCSLNLDYAGTAYSCDSALDCPPDLTCAAHVCVGASAFGAPANSLEVAFLLDDTANRTYTAGELQYAGTFHYDVSTRILTIVSSWDGPFLPLYDDGPWTAGGHESAMMTAGDHVWSTAAFVTVPTTSVTLQFGPEQVTPVGWLWPQPTAPSVTIPANRTEPFAAGVLALDPFGDVDFRLTINTGSLDAAFTFTAGGSVAVKGDYNLWQLDSVGTGVGTFTFTLSDWVGTGHAYRHQGLLRHGQAVQWVFVLGGQQYRVNQAAENPCYTAGVTAQVKAPGGAWTPVAITTVQATGTEFGNSMIMVP